MEKESAHFIRNAKQIVYHLNLLINGKRLLSAHFGENNETFITTILELDQKKNRIILECGPKDYQNKQLLDSKLVEFRSDYEGIKVSFTAEKIKKIRYQGQNALLIETPQTLYWLQRRQFYRVKVPFSHNSYCEIKLPDNEKGGEKLARFKLLNLSISGFCFMNEHLELSEIFLPTTEFHDCTLHLNGNDQETISFVIKNKLNINPEKASKGQRIGCNISKITPAGESRIQRYMQSIERESKSLL